MCCLRRFTKLVTCSRRNGCGCVDISFVVGFVVVVIDEDDDDCDDDYVNDGVVDDDDD